MRQQWPESLQKNVLCAELSKGLAVSTALAKHSEYALQRGVSIADQVALQNEATQRLHKHRELAYLLSLKAQVEKEKAFGATVRGWTGSPRTRPPGAWLSAPLATMCSIPLCTQPSKVEQFFAYEGALYGGRELQHAYLTSVLMHDAKRHDEVGLLQRTLPIASMWLLAYVAGSACLCRS